MIRKLILETADSYVGQKEIRGNKGFINSHFQAKMEAVGWEKGQAWCSYLAELIMVEAYGKINSFMSDEITKAFSANAVETYNRLAARGFDADIHPEPGDVVVWM